MTNALLQSKQSAGRWAELFQRALVECVDVEEAVLVASLAHENLPADVMLSTEDKLGNLHGDADGQFVKKGEGDSKKE